MWSVKEGLEAEHPDGSGRHDAQGFPGEAVGTAEGGS